MKALWLLACVLFPAWPAGAADLFPLDQRHGTIGLAVWHAWGMRPGPRP